MVDKWWDAPGMGWDGNVSPPPPPPRPTPPHCRRRHACRGAARLQVFTGKKPLAICMRLPRSAVLSSFPSRALSKLTARVSPLRHPFPGRALAKPTVDPPKSWAAQASYYSPPCTGRGRHHPSPSMPHTTGNPETHRSPH